MLADLLAAQAEGLFRGQSQRHYDFRQGEMLDKKDHIITWKKPARPAWMNKKTYLSYPKKIRIREFKVAGKVYVTTLLNAQKYYKKELAKLYELRWQVEINLRSIKTVMGMEMLSCKTPEMVRKEIGIHLLGYNFIRTIMAEACQKYGNQPNQISFKGTVQLINQWMPHFLHGNENKNKRLYAELLKRIIENKVGDRPGRVEPRAVKRRPKPFPLLHNRRIVEKRKLMKKIKKLISRNAYA